MGKHAVKSDDSQLELFREPRANVRFTKSEYERLLYDSVQNALSIPQLLKEAYFRNPPTKILMSRDCVKQFLGAFNKIGNNINQLSRSANTRGNVDANSLLAVREELGIIHNYILRFNGGN